MPRKKIDELQILRALAAIAVVATHAATQAERSLSEQATGWLIPAMPELTHFCHFGVDLFFVISGFVMVYVHYHDFEQPGARRRFLSRRLARIVPIYWLLTAAGVTLLAIAPQLFSFREAFDWRWIICSFLFVPIESSDGVRCPVLGPGWTLNFEMYFYAVFAVALALPRSVGMAGVAGFFTLSIGCGLLLQPESMWGQMVTSCLLAEFLLGCGVAWLYRNRRETLTAFANTMIIAAAIAIAVGSPFVDWLDHPRRLMLWGIPSAMIVAGACVSDWRFPGKHLAVTLGHASYSIYLTHVFALAGTGIALRAIGLSQHMPLEGNAAILVLASVAVGVAFWWLIEKPITRLLNHRLSAPAPHPETKTTPLLTKAV